MPILKDKNFPEFRGLHLWHAPMSSCSQRVRIALCLKELSWVSHPLKLDKGEHAKSEYLAINPKGLVPSLINDGEVITESIDILSYIEGKFGQLGNQSLSESVITEGQYLLQKIDEAQKDVKTCSFFFLFRVRSMMNDNEFVFFQNNHSNIELVKFHERFRTGLSRKEVQESVERSLLFFKLIEAQIEKNNGYLLNGSFSIYDLALVPNVHRFSLMRWPFEEYPNISSWFKRIKSKDWFKLAILDWEPPELIDTFSDFVGKSKNDNISAFL